MTTAFSHFDRSMCTCFGQAGDVGTDIGTRARQVRTRRAGSILKSVQSLWYLFVLFSFFIFDLNNSRGYPAMQVVAALLLLLVVVALVTRWVSATSEAQRKSTGATNSSPSTPAAIAAT